MSVLDIRSAIGQERDATPAYYDFKVLESVLEGGLCRITIQPQAVYPKVVLDESLEDAEAWWPKPHKGSAKVLAVAAEEDQIILKGATSRPPVKDGLLRIYPPQYLDALLHCWLDNSWAHQAMACWQGLDTSVRVAANPLSGHAFRWLRRAQRQALKLVQYSSSFLYGPPGTGKTTTLGVLLAEYLHMNPRARVLLLSTTNHAVDQATVAVDKALEQSKREALRKTIKRLGSRFVASHYAGREHLLPVHDKRLIKQLADLQAQRPSDTELAELRLWKEQVQALEQKLRSQSLEVLRQNRLSCMTTTRAAFTLQDLRTLPTFDLVVFDEAHKYIENDDLVSGLVEVVREMRHKGTSIMVASQDPPSVPISLIELSSQIVMHKFNSPAWLRHIQKANAALGELTANKMSRLGTGEAYVWSSKASDDTFTRGAVKIKCRPRITQHGGGTKTAVNK